MSLQTYNNEIRIAANLSSDELRVITSNADDFQYPFRTFAQAIEQNELPARWMRKLEAEAAEQKKKALATKRQRKALQKQPWLADVTQAPRRRRSYAKP